MSSSFRPRQRGPTKDAWQAIRPRFTRLYLQEAPRLKLQIIKDFLGQEADFHAELHNYKLRIKQWDLCRNLKASEKGDIARELEAHAAQGLQPPQRTLHHRRVRRDKVARYVQHCQRSAGVHIAAEENSPRSSSMDHSSMGKDPSTYVQRRAIPKLGNPRPEPQCWHDCAEVALHAVKEWHQWYFCTQSQPDYFDEDDHAVRCANTSGIADELVPVKPWCDCVRAGLNSLHLGLRVDVYAKFDQGCTQFVAALSRQPVDLVIDIFRIFCVSDWERCPEFKFCILGHLFSMVKLKLGLQHPLARFLQCLHRDNDLTSPIWACMARKVISDVFGESTWRRREEFFRAYSLLLCLDCTEHESMSSQSTALLARLSSLQAEATQVLGNRHWITTRIQYRWCRSLAGAGALDTARTVLLGMLGLSDDEGLIEAMDEFSWQHSVDPCSTYYVFWLLSAMAWNASRYQESLACSRKCFRWSLDDKIGQRANAAVHLSYLEDALIVTESWSELALLRKQYIKLQAALPDRLRLFEIPDYEREQEPLKRGVPRP